MFFSVYATRIWIYACKIATFFLFFLLKNNFEIPKSDLPLARNIVQIDSLIAVIVSKIETIKFPRLITGVARKVGLYI